MAKAVARGDPFVTANRKVLWERFIKYSITHGNLAKKLFAEAAEKLVRRFHNKIDKGRMKFKILALPARFRVKSNAL